MCERQPDLLKNEDKLFFSISEATRQRLWLTMGSAMPVCKWAR